MSLLLEALKKAELAKQNTAAGTPGAADAATPVITREKLPDISQPLEILSEDLPSAREKAQAAPAPDAPAAEQPALGEPARPQPASGARARTTPRDSARQLFEVKESEYNPRRPFHLTIAALVLVAAGYGGYLWWQLQPKYAYPAPTAGATPAPVAAGSIVERPQAAAPFAAAEAPAAASAAQARRAPPAPGAEAPAAVPASGPSFVRSESASPAAAPREAARPAIAVKTQPPQVDPLVERGYQSAQKGEFAAAREAYEQALAREPASRDALLGLAALDVRAGRFEAADSRYQKLLELDPRDAHANAALIGLRGQIDPVFAESRLKLLLANQPEAAYLHFALGNQYALQSRWPEAQAAYFKAYTADADNADYAFNLAISLERLRQPKPALEYYRRALGLAAARPAGFDRAQAEARVRELSK